jgi:predicted Fe-S protein YdhL (DUF1289 family)
MSAEPPAPQLASPCVGTCRLDSATGWCVGCGRDIDELTRWRELDAARRAAVWAELPKRLRRLGQDCRLLPWQPEAALAGLAMLAKEPGAVLVMGVEGAVAEFMAGRGGTVFTRQYGDLLELHTTGARARLVAHPGLRVFKGRGRMALTLHQSRLKPMPSVINEVGSDRDAVREADRGQTLIDLGLGRKGLRFAVRLAEPALLRLARREAGRPLFDAAELIAALVAAAPTRVLVSPLGRVEIDGPIDRADPECPHTHLLPEHLASDRPLESGLVLPDAYVASALMLEPAPERLRTSSQATNRGETP